MSPHVLDFTAAFMEKARAEGVFRIRIPEDWKSHADYQEEIDLLRSMGFTVYDQIGVVTCT